MDPIYRITLPFRDIDMHGHMHNAAYVSHFEAALSHFLRANALADEFQPDGETLFLVRKVEVTYEAPCHYDETIEVVTKLARIGSSSLTFTPIMQDTEKRAKAWAEVVWIHIDKATGRPVPMAETLKDKLAAL